MAVQIAKGQTKQADLLETFTVSSQPSPSWQVSGGPPSAFPQGWNLTATGVLTIPAGTGLALGYRTAFYIDAGNGTESTARRYEFEMVEAQSDCDFTIAVEAVTAVTQAQKGQASSIPFSATCFKVVGGVTQFLAKAVSVTVDWGDGTSSTHTINTSALGPTSASFAHTYATRGTKTVTATATVAECSGSGTSSGSVQVVDYRWKCEGGQCNRYDVADGSGYATEAECLNSGCGFPGSGWYCVVSGGTQTPTQLADGAAWVAAGRPTPKYAAEIDCPCYSGPVWWCVNGVPTEGTNPPSGVTTYASEQACRDAGCKSTIPKYRRWRCNSQGLCEEFTTTNQNEGFESCEAANCTGIIEPPLYTRYRCNSAGVCESFYTFNINEGFADCIAANCTPPVEPCHYNSYSIADRSEGNTLITLALFRKTNPGWTLKVTHAINDRPQPNPLIQTAEEWWNWSVPKVVGAHHFIAQLTKTGCPTQIEERTVYVETPPPPVNPGGQECPDCPDCPPYPPEAEEFECAPGVSIQLPAASATLKNFALVRVQVSDPNEETDPCHHNYPRPCNGEGPDLAVFVGEYQVPTSWKKISGTFNNGVWEGLFDTRDLSNGTKVLKVSTRGVGCCRTYSTVSVTLANTLQGNIFYRDTYCAVQAGYVVGDAMIGVETRALLESTSRRYWQQWGVRSGTTLDGAYKHEDWPKHQPVLPRLGAQWDEQGERFERHNYSAHVTFRLPLAREVRFRRKWTPQFFLAAYDLDCESVVKIREMSAGKHYIWTQNPPRLWVYDGEAVTKLGDFGDATKTAYYAPDALDGALWTSDANGRKIIVVTPTEVFAYDPDSGDVTLNYSPRGETLAPRFVEVVGGVPISIHTGASTRAYDLRFGSPKQTWALADEVTFCTVDGDTLFVACGEKLYSGNGLTAPTLVKDFGANVTAASKTFVGLENSEVWKKLESGWEEVHTHTGAVNGVTSWTGGTNGEAQTEDARGVAAGEGDWLLGERANGSWYDERELVVPLDLVIKTVVSVAALDHFSVDAEATASEDDAEQLPQRDERLLVGTGNSGLFFVYQRSLLSEKDGAIPVSHDSVPRVFPFGRRE